MRVIYNADARTSQAEIKKAWGVWLDNLAEWVWWVTLTFRDPSEKDQRRGWTKIGTDYAKRAWNSFIKALEGSTEEKVGWCCGTEYQRWRGVPHYHALINGVGGLRRLDWMDWWYNRYGIARILPYDKTKGAGRYISKYVVKELGDIDFGGLTTGVICVIPVTTERVNARHPSEQRSLCFHNAGVIENGRAGIVDTRQNTFKGVGACQK
jgi:hypothetical protein